MTPIIGIHTANYAQRQADVGNLKMGRVFPLGMPWDPHTMTPADVVAKVKAAIIPVMAAGMKPFWEMKFKQSDVVSGAADAHIMAIFDFAQTIVNLDGQYPNSSGTYFHEPEPKMPGSDFVAAYNHISRMIPLGRQWSFGPVFQAYAWRSVAQTAYVPDLGKADFVGIDVYSSDGMFGNDCPLAQHPGFQKILATIPPAHPIFVCERGISTGENAPVKAPIGQQGAVLEKDRNYLNSLGERFYGLLYWDGGGATDGTSVYLLNAGGVASLKKMAALASPIPRTSNGTPYYTPSTPGAPTGQIYFCGLCFSYVVGSKIEDHANSLHAQA